MPVYLVAFVDIHDQDRYANEYVPGVLEVVNKFGGKLLAAADSVSLKEGNWPPGRSIIIEFPDMTAAENWYNSAEYQPLLKLRSAIATSSLAFLQGV